MLSIVLTGCGDSGENEENVSTNNTRDNREVEADVQSQQKPVGERSNRENSDEKREQNDEGKTITLERTERRQSEEQNAQSRREVIPLTRRDRLLAQRGVAPVHPADFTLGVLYRPSINRDVEQIRSVIETFFGSLSEGKIAAHAVHEEWRDHLARSLRRYLDDGLLPRSVRIAAFLRPEDDSVAVDVRLTGNPGTTTGTIYLIRDDQQWYITDLHADLSLLTVPPEKSENSFQPRIRDGNID